MISNKQEAENEAIKVGFILLKIELIEKVNNHFCTRFAGSFQLPNAV